MGNGDGTFQTTGIPETAVQINDQSFLIVAGDFNGDGIDDLAVGNNPNIQVSLGSNSGAFGSPTNYSLGSVNPFSAMVTGDFRGNGKLDLVASANGNTIFMLLGNGDGTFQTPVPYSEPGVYGLTPGYFNNDGFLDLAVTYGGGSSLGLVLGNGDGTLQNGIVHVADETLIDGSPYTGFFDNAGTPSLGLLALVIPIPDDENSASISTPLRLSAMEMPRFRRR